MLSRFDFNNQDMQTAIANGLSTLDEETFYRMVQQLIPNLDIFLGTCFESLKNNIRNQIKWLVSQKT